MQLVFLHMLNRKEGNDQESIQLSHTSHQRHQRKRNTNTKELDPNENIISRKPNGQLPLTFLQVDRISCCLVGFVLSCLSVAMQPVCVGFMC